jgi:hypothetical protein
VRPVNLADVADELYALTPAEFRAARDERAAGERAAGHRDLASAISKLRRPTVSAWLVNQLAREAAGEVGSLLDLGEALRAAQNEMAGDRLRELSRQRREALPSLIQDAKRIASRAGQPVSAQVEREVLATFEAALADPASAEAVRSGWLTSPLSYVGLGGEDLAEAVAVPLAPGERKVREEPARARRRKEPAQARRKEPGAAAVARGNEPEGAAQPRRRERQDTAEARRQERDEAAEARRQERDEAAARRAAREAEAAASDLRESESMADEARQALAAADRRAADVRGQQQNVTRRIEELEQQLAAAEVERAEVARSLREAQRSREAAARSLDAARRRLTRAQARVERHRASG